MTAHPRQSRGGRTHSPSTPAILTSGGSDSATTRSLLTPLPASTSPRIPNNTPPPPSCRRPGTCRPSITSCPFNPSNAFSSLQPGPLPLLPPATLGSWRRIPLYPTPHFPTATLHLLRTISPATTRIIRHLPHTPPSISTHIPKHTPHKTTGSRTAPHHSPHPLLPAAGVLVAAHPPATRRCLASAYLGWRPSLAALLLPLVRPSPCVTTRRRGGFQCYSQQLIPNALLSLRLRRGMWHRLG